MNTRWTRKGPRMDALALADAISAVAQAAEAMYNAGDLTPLYIEDLHSAAAEARRVELLAAVRRMRAIRSGQGGHGGQNSADDGVTQGE